MDRFIHMFCILSLLYHRYTSSPSDSGDSDSDYSDVDSADEEKKAEQAQRRKEAKERSKEKKRAEKRSGESKPKSSSKVRKDFIRRWTEREREREKQKERERESLQNANLHNMISAKKRHSMLGFYPEWNEILLSSFSPCIVVILTLHADQH